MPKIFSAANAALRATPAAAIVRALADAAERWCDADFPPRVRAMTAIERRLGYTTPTIDYALDRLFRGITAAALIAAATSELGSLAALDGFVAVHGRPDAWARGAGRVTIVSSDTTIGVAIPALVFALLAKCAVTVKDRSDAVVAAFAETLAEELPALGAAIDVRAWTGGADEPEGAVLGAADVVVAFGGSDALRAIRAQCAPDATFVAFGHRASAAYLTARDLNAATDTLAADVARDALLYDGDGCLSLHLLFLERCDAAVHDRFIALLGAACAAHTVEFPAGSRAPARAAAANAYAGGAAFRAANGAGRVLRARDGAWSIVAAAALEPPPPFGAGVIPVVTVDGIDDLAAQIAQHAIPLQALGVASFGDATALAERLGAVRIAAIGTMQDPPLAGHHGGRARIADFIRWADRA